uniref:FAT domain-containing protein n=1 Tax=Macrostomum lignano TaxID=282301 RepID=A0A1I8FBC7_9PLAT
QTLDSILVVAQCHWQAAISSLFRAGRPNNWTLLFQLKMAVGVTHRPQLRQAARQILAGNPRITRRGHRLRARVLRAPTADSCFEASRGWFASAVAGAAEAADSGSGSPLSAKSAESQQRHQQVSESSNKNSDTMRWTSASDQRR